MKKRYVKIISDGYIHEGKYGKLKYNRVWAECPFCHNDTMLYFDYQFNNFCKHYAGKTEKFFIFVKGKTSLRKIGYDEFV